MKTVDWIVVGGGITGAALAYELAKKGFSVLLLEQHASLQGASRFSYGGLAYWAATTPLTRQMCADGIDRYRTLAAELDADIQLRELDLLLTVAAKDDLEAVAAAYAHVVTPPKLLSVADACVLEPLLNPAAIAGALTVKHGHIHPEKATQGYTQAFIRAGGAMQLAQVVGLLREGKQIRGVITATETYYSANVVICAGGMSRHFLKSAGIPIRLYFTHAEIVETPPVAVQLSTLVMPAQTQRFLLEAESSTPKFEQLWDEPGHEPVPPILDAGAIQFIDGSIRIGQLSRVLTNPDAKIDSMRSETALRTSIGQVLPTLRNLPGTWHHCLVGFSPDRLPLIGAIPDFEGIHVFSGFSNPLAIIPPLAQRFANWATGQEDEIIAQLSPNRDSLSSKTGD
ncbi:MAG: FAD-binding oxidoreductase [Chroococcidiopsidaceae cyanobacterium CP_BM_ER_R8_30]|nr:FAD-binding oxidoreductase [Chroococcidiopsidaceae cyanobacterium CP_BM_ER_R8_30]